MTTFSQLLAQILGTTPTFEGGPGGPGPVPMAPSAAYPEQLPDVGFDLWMGPGGYHSSPRPAWLPYDWQAPGGYVPPAVPTPWEAAGGPLDPYSGLGSITAMYPPATANVWGVPVLPDALRQYWTDQARGALERDPWNPTPHYF